MAYNTNIFRRAFEAIEENLLKVDRFNGKIVGGVFTEGQTQEELAKIYGDFKNGRGSCFELAVQEMRQDGISDNDQFTETVVFNARYMHSYRPGTGYPAGSQEEFDNIIAGLLNTFSVAVDGTTPEGVYYRIEKIDRTSLKFPGSESFGISQLDWADTFIHVHAATFNLEITLESVT